MVAVPSTVLLDSFQKIRSKHEGIEIFPAPFIYRPGDESQMKSLKVGREHMLIPIKPLQRGWYGTLH